MPFWNKLKRFVAHSFKFCYRSKRNEEINFVLINIFFMLCKSIEHLRCSLRMTNITDFLFSWLINYFLDLSREIMFSKILEAEIKKLFKIFVWIDIFMASWILVSSVISKPDIISCSSKYKCRSEFGIMINPCVCGWE